MAREREARPSRMDNMLRQMLGMDQLMDNDLRFAGAAQDLMTRQKAGPLSVEQQQLANELLRQQAQAAPGITQSRQRNADLDAIGNLAQGLSYASPQEAPDIIGQLLAKGNYYKPDPDAKLRQMAAARGMTLEQLKQELQGIQTR